MAVTLDEPAFVVSLLPKLEGAAAGTVGGLLVDQQQSSKKKQAPQQTKSKQ